MTLPIIVLVLGWCLTALAMLGARVMAIDTAAQAARMVGRGDSIEVGDHHNGSHVTGIDRVEGTVCVRVESDSTLLPVAARACALDGGQ